jgi:hypothetical protein
MTKIRLEGTLNDVRALVAYFNDKPEIKILSQSEPYANRGKSVYVRVYLDVELNHKEGD